MAESTAPHLLLIEDDTSLRESLVLALQRLGWRVSAHSRAEPALHGLVALAPDVVLTDLRLPGAGGLEVLARCRELDAGLPVVLMTGHGDVATAVQAMRGGAHDFIEKPFGRDRLAVLLERALGQRRLAAENHDLREALRGARALAQSLRGDSPALHALRALVLQLAPLPADVLLLGETGTGKELVARALHDHSGRGGPFVAINCAALPETLMEAELFGHAAGAFTGAQRAQVGRITHAHRGTLFLDELEAMPASLQAKLLRVLQERELRPLGSNETLALDLRVVAAANEPLRRLVDEGRLRADLYYRLEAVTLSVPPLRERRDDIPALFGHFVAQAAARFGREAPPVAPVLMAALLARPWPGNVRELRGAAERHALGLPALREAGPAEGPAEPTLAETLAAVEAGLLRDALRRAQGNAVVAGARLGLPPATLYRRLKSAGLRPEDFRDSTPP
jgi:two-component system C4-dicarboxylate transport response regulator DctD